MSVPTRARALDNVSKMKEVAWGLVSTAAVVAAARLRIAETLDDGPLAAPRLAEAVGADLTALGQLMNGLVARGVFAVDPDGRYRNNDLSLLLREDDPNSVRSMVQWIGYDGFWMLWPHLESAVRTGRPQSVDVLGKDFFRYVHENTPEIVATFSGAMTEASNHTSEAVVEALDLAADVTRVVDVGGGQGHLLRTVLERHPSVTGTLLDLPGVVVDALPDLLAGGTLADRATVIGGDCREEIPVEADVYLFKNILDWDDESTRRSIRNVTERAPSGARVCIVETLADRTPEPAVTSSLDLLLLVNVGGRKRTADEVGELMRASGLEVVGLRPTGTFLTVVEGRVV